MIQRAVIITVGNELLRGQTIDTNSAFLAQQLAAVGLEVKLKLSIGDCEDDIISALETAEQNGSVIVLSGGLGPTSDDRTKSALARRYDRPLVFHESVMQAVDAHFRRLGRHMPEINRNQALLPQGSLLLPNAHGTAWGIWIEHDGKDIIALPGVPFELKPMVVEHLMPRLRQKLQLPPLLYRTLHVYGIGESALAERIADIEHQLPPQLSLAYLPHYSVVRLRLNASGADQQTLQALLAEAEQKLLQRLGNAVFGFDDTSLEAELGNMLRAAGKSVATAESCTGGAVAARIVEIPGASDYFIGGVVTYSNELKQQLLNVSAATLQQHGAVSEPTVLEMLRGLFQLFPTDYGAAISGIAGPDGGSPQKPVGTVWIAVGNRHHHQAHRFLFRGNRTDIITYAALNTLGLLLQCVRADQQHP
ncbi:MAG: competence/damage-inducible protein A [Chitinophagales bacterium]|nr:competence/damage-inducible protein A [Chitinophagales bacterium]MDW8427370.1 competence/damage-inducible protein A [Chitinophagales bacterium]